MKLALIIALTGASLLTNLGCREAKERSATVVWSRGQGAPPAVLAAKQFETIDRSVWLQEEIVEHADQRFGAARVEGGSLHKVIDESGNLLFARADYSVAPDADLEVSLEAIQKLHNERFKFLETAKRRMRALKGKQVLGEPEVVISPERDVKNAYYALQVLDLAMNHVSRYLITPDFRLKDREVISSHFKDVEAVLFSASAERELKEVLLKRLAQSGKLESGTHSVMSQTPQNANPENAPFRFPLDDPRFDQVQIFYFIQQGAEFFAKELGFSLPTAVRVESGVGYPDKTNAAFAAGSQIWLGTGDGKETINLSKDPTVVMHELGHVLIHFVARLPNQGEGGSINEGFADYLAATQLGSPLMGTLSCLNESCRRNLDNSKTYEDRKGGLYHDSLIVSGTLWQLRTELGASVTNKLVLKTLSRLGPAKKLVDFSFAAKMAADFVLKPEQLPIFNKVMTARKWPL